MTLIKGVAVAGIGETGYYKRGTAPYGAIGLCVKAILNACEDAGLDPHEIDGFCSYGDDRNEGVELATALGCNELRWSSLVWGGGGGGLCGALAHAAAAIISGQARHVVVLRGHAESGAARLMTAVSLEHMNVHFRAHGVISPTQVCALRARRLVDHDGVSAETFKAIAQACYFHAANNPGAVGRDVVLDDETYAASRLIAEPYRLFDCSRENDGAGAVLLTSLEEARTLRRQPVHLSAVAQSTPRGWGPLIDNDEDYTSAGFKLVSERLWEATGLTNDDIDVTQVYENVSGAAVAALIDHGFCSAESAGEVLTLENLIAPTGSLPINTSGGSIAEGFVHGIGLTLEAVRQIRGESSNQIPDARVSLLIGGPVAPFVSSAIFTAEEL
ncbi:MAG: thiolase C-terminal domain-containing protein [Solirubrobacteraceae bacterium]